jgi:ActR/RegA family two-component response regulator
MRKRVLVVDDDPLMRRASARALSAAGFDVVVAGAALEALGPTGPHTFDTAILDYYLGPGECGCNLIALLRSRNPRTRIVILSGLGVLPELVQHAYRAGADLVASKPNVDWHALASGDTTNAPDSARSAIDFAAFKRAVIHGTYLVHRRNVTSTARSLGISRSSLQRMLRRNPPPDLFPADEE